MQSRILTYLINKFKTREQVGLKKYNSTIDRTDLSYRDWSIHHEEELMDALMYNARARAEYQALAKAAHELEARLSTLQKSRYECADTLRSEINDALARYKQDITHFRIQESESCGTSLKQQLR